MEEIGIPMYYIIFIQKGGDMKIGTLTFDTKIKFLNALSVLIDTTRDDLNIVTERQ